jgi:rhodanese-related sulfurtransferase
MISKSYLKDGIPTINPEDVLTISEASIVDVRTSDEYSGELGHIEEAQLVTLGPLLEDFLNKRDKKRPIIFVCRSGARSARASQLAMELGFGIVFNMEGGMIKWNELGLPVKR